MGKDTEAQPKTTDQLPAKIQKAEKPKAQKTTNPANETA
jgi:hypothetical protein